MSSSGILDHLINFIGKFSHHDNRTKKLKRELVKLNPIWLASGKSEISKIDLSQFFFNRNGLYMKCLASSGLFAYSCSLLALMALQKSFTRGYYLLHKFLGRHTYSLFILLAYPEYILYRNNAILEHEIRRPEFEQLFSSESDLESKVQQLLLFKYNCLSSAMIESRKKSTMNVDTHTENSKSKIEERIPSEAKVPTITTMRNTANFIPPSQATAVHGVSVDPDRYSYQDIKTIIRQYPKNAFESD